jgi:uncharacterized protein YcbK (DUF882 family)
MTRREMLSRMVKGAAVAFIPGVSTSAFASLLPHKPPISGNLSFYNIHTHETLSVRYLNKNRCLDKGAIVDLNYLFRCHYDDKVHPIKTELFFLLDEIRTRLGKTDRPYQLISGYRSPSYNRKLRKLNCGVAQKSYHLYGMAADVLLEDVPQQTLWEKAVELKKGGVGRYSKFIHIDVGPVRCW